MKPTQTFTQLFFNLLLALLLCFSFGSKAAENNFELSDTKFIYSVEYQGIDLGKIHVSFEKKQKFDFKDYSYSIDGLEDFYYYSLTFYPEGIADFFVDRWVSEHWLSFYQQKLVNLSYFSSYQGFFKDRKINVISDLHNQKNLNKDTNQVFDAPFPNLNSYTVFLALAFDLLKDANLEENQTMIYHTSKDDESKKRELVYSNRAKIKTAAGNYFSLVFKLDESKYQTTVFVSQDFSYLPVKILSVGSRGTIKIELFKVLNH